MKASLLQEVLELTAFRENLRGLASPKADLLADSGDDGLVAALAPAACYSLFPGTFSLAV